MGREVEGDDPVFRGAQAERPGHLRAEELHQADLLTLAVLRFHPGDQPQRDVFDVGVEVTTLDPHLAAQRPTGLHAWRGQDRVHRRGPDTEGSQHPFEDHGFLSLVVR